jgi:predicted nucleotidyltransferase
MSANKEKKIKTDTKLKSEQDYPNKENKRAIDLLFGSGTRIDILWAYLSNPDQWLEPRDLATLTRHTLSDVQRNNTILESLELIEHYAYCGPLNPRAIGGAFPSIEELSVFGNRFTLNKDHPWIPALRMLLEKSIGSLRILSDAIQKIPDIDVAFVFGSFATSEQRPDSDIDLMVIGKHDFSTLAEPVSNVEERIGREVNYIAYTPEEWREKFAGRNHFVSSLVDSPKVFLVGDSSILDRITVPLLNEI